MFGAVRQRNELVLCLVVNRLLYYLVLVDSKLHSVLFKVSINVKKIGWPHHKVHFLAHMQNIS